MSRKLEIHDATSNEVCPDLVDAAVYGPHRSHVVRGLRYWIFESEEGYLKFKADLAQHKFKRSAVSQT